MKGGQKMKTQLTVLLVLFSTLNLQHINAQTDIFNNDVLRAQEPLVYSNTELSDDNHSYWNTEKIEVLKNDLYYNGNQDITLRATTSNYCPNCKKMQPFDDSTGKCTVCGYLKDNQSGLGTDVTPLGDCLGLFLFVALLYAGKKARRRESTKGFDNSLSE